MDPRCPVSFKKAVRRRARRFLLVLMDTAYLGLGSNQGNRLSHLRGAVGRIEEVDSVALTAGSPVYETEAHTIGPDEQQPPFLNAVVEAEVTCAPKALLRIAKRLEREAGREPGGERWSPRPLDVDLLVVGDLTCRREHLILPHPRLGERRFVLQPWADLAPNLVVPPPFEATVQVLLDTCPDASSIRKTDHELGQGGR